MRVHNEFIHITTAIDEIGDPIEGFHIEVFQGNNILERVGPSKGKAFKNRESAERYARMNYPEHRIE